MAVELDVRWVRSCEGEALGLRIGEILQERLCLTMRPSVRVDSVSRESGKEIPPDPDLLIRVDEIAEVSVMLHKAPGESGYYACISYASLRSPQSKILCLATAVALAEHGGVAILDDGNLFGTGRWIDPAHAFAGMIAPEETGDFSQQAARAAGRVEMRRKLRTEE